mmetsp:Transcript_15301/g.32597  ORF Transcript_15301/g.32597 Transcript_15301/m.32597 type:complete len:213 (+) Transcript_15301:446-1084(+)
MYPLFQLRRLVGLRVHQAERQPADAGRRRPPRRVVPRGVRRRDRGLPTEPAAAHAAAAVAHAAAGGAASALAASPRAARAVCPRTEAAALHDPALPVRGHLGCDARRRSLRPLRHLAHRQLFLRPYRALPLQQALARPRLHHNRAHPAAARAGLALHQPWRGGHLRPALGLQLRARPAHLVSRPRRALHRLPELRLQKVPAGHLHAARPRRR